MESNAQASVLTLTQTVGQALGADRRWEDSGRTVWGRFENSDFRVLEKWKQLGIVATHLWFFDVDPQLTDLTTALSYGGQRYEVRNVEDVQNMGRRWEVVTELIRAQPL
jgi:hypothetical protein